MKILIYVLSDLKIKSIMKTNIAFIKSIPDEEFTLQAWSEAYEYLLGADSTKDAKKRILD